MLRLGIVRFRRLLENARRLIDLVQDGKEKLDGEYIFDRQYVVSLVDGAVVQLGRLVFDAHVLAPHEAEPLFTAYDGQREEAARLLSAAIDGTEDARRTDLAASPELRLLRDAVRWMEGSAGTRDRFPLALLGEVLDRATLGLAALTDRAAPDRSIELVVRRGRRHLDLIDLEGLEGWSGETARSLPSLRNRPLDRMLAGAEHDPVREESRDSEAPGRWLAVVSDHQLSLFGARDDSRIVAEASLTGEPARDFVFLWSQTAQGLRGVDALGLSPHRTGAGQAAWSYDVSTDDLEQGLVGLGEVLWGARGRV